MVLKEGWSLIKVVSHQGGLSSGQSFIRVVSHQGGLSSGWFLIRVASHQGGLKSGRPLIRVVSHQGGLKSGWSLIRVVSYLGGLSPGAPVYSKACYYEQATLWCGMKRYENSCHYRQVIFSHRGVRFFLFFCCVPPFMEVVQLFLCGVSLFPRQIVHMTIFISPTTWAVTFALKAWTKRLPYFHVHTMVCPQAPRSFIIHTDVS